MLLIPSRAPTLPSSPGPGHHLPCQLAADAEPSPSRGKPEAHGFLERNTRDNQSQRLRQYHTPRGGNAGNPALMSGQTQPCCHPSPLTAAQRKDLLAVQHGFSLPHNWNSQLLLLAATGEVPRAGFCPVRHVPKVRAETWDSALWIIKFSQHLQSCLDKMASFQLLSLLLGPISPCNTVLVLAGVESTFCHSG